MKAAAARKDKNLLLIYNSKFKGTITMRQHKGANPFAIRRMAGV